MSWYLLSSAPAFVQLVIACRPYRERVRNAYREYRRLGFLPGPALQSARLVAGPAHLSDTLPVRSC